jgi:hypothetical protein
MKKTIVILSAFFLLTQWTARADQEGRDPANRRMMDHGNLHGSASLSKNMNLKLTAEQAKRLSALDEKYARELDLTREQLYSKGQELKAEWLQTNPDRGRIEILQREATKLQERMRATLAAHHAEVLKILNLEQRTHVPDYEPGRIFYKPAGVGRR